jgi:hypothetical protein
MDIAGTASVASYFMQLTQAKAKVDELVPTFLEKLKDTTIPLDLRWTLYVDAVGQNIIVRDEMYGDGYGSILIGPNCSLYDQFYLERGQSMTFPEMIERVNESREYEDDDIFDTVTDESIIAWKEKVLSMGYASFTNDW